MIYRQFLSRALAERNHLCSFGRRHPGEQFCKIILKLDLLLRR